jgi:hypothetical protein
MIVFINDTHDPSARHLFDDLQASGILITDESSDPYDVQLVVLSPATVQSVDWDAVRAGDKPVINVVIAPCALPTAMPGIVLDLSQDYVGGYRDVIRQLYKFNAERKLNPYRGFASYGEVEAPLFSGRGAITKQVYEHVENGARFLVVVGASGGGKTSFIRAGLTARLRGSADAWLPLVVTLDNDPLRQIAARLFPFVTDRDKLVSRLYTNPTALGDVLGEIASSHGKVFLAFDSFERVFTRVSLTDRVYFLDVLFDAINRNRGNYLVGIALRTDFEAKLLEYPKWKDLLASNVFRIPALKRVDLTDIVKSPAQEVGLNLADELMERLVEDASHLGKSGSLLGLSLILQQLAAAKRMIPAEYEALGGISGVVSHYAENIFGRLTPVQQNAAKQLLLHLIDFTDDGTPAARPISRKQLTFTWASHSDIDSTLDNLLKGQLLSRFIDFETGEHYFQLGHESLVEEWSRYKEWVSEDRENLRYGSHLERLAVLWSEREYAVQGLLRGSALDEAISWTQNPDRLPSPLLQNFVAVSSEIRRNYETQQRVQSVRQRRANVALMMAFVVALFVIAGGAFLLVRTTGERDTVATLQADTENHLATATSVNHALALQLDMAATTQAEAEMQIATSVAQYNQVSTAQAQAEYDKATAVALADLDKSAADATIEALVNLQAPAATAVANAQYLQATLDASIKTQQILNEFVAGQLAQSANELLTTQPDMALHLAAEAASRLLVSGADGTNPVVAKALRDSLKANALFDFGDTMTQGWLLDGNSYAVIQYSDKPAELWALDTLEVVTTFENPIEQLLPVAGGKLFLVDYADDAVDELWNTVSGAAAAQLSGDIAPPPDENSSLKIPNLVQLDNNTRFIVKYSDGTPSELWDDAAAIRVAVLDGDMEGVVALDDGYFFVRYVDNRAANAIWQTKSGEKAQAAEDVIAVPYDNGIFVLRRDRAYDEIWTTNPFAKVTQVVGRVESVTTLADTPYFLIRFTGQAGAEIWQDTTSPQKVYTFRGPIDVTMAYADGKYFFVRYKDDSPSEMWSTSPLQVASILSGDLQTLQIPSLLADEIVVIDYSNNAVSDVWSLKDGLRIAQLNGNVQKVNSIWGDVFFTVQYEGEQPAEVWSAIEAKELAKLGDQNRVVKSITPLKDGKFLIVAYNDAPAEIWSVGDDGVASVGPLSDVVRAVYPFEQGDYFVVSHQNTAAQIWLTGAAEPLLTLPSDVAVVSYNAETKRLGLVTAENHSFEMNFGRLLQSADESLTAANPDLLALVCQQIAENPPVTPGELSAFLGGIPAMACMPDPGSE